MKAYIASYKGKWSVIRMKNDYCTCFPETIEGINISSACKLHDNMCGEKGSYWFFDTIAPFYNKLRELGVSKKWSVVITIGGTLIYAIKFPYLCYKKNAYRNERIMDGY